MVSSICAFDALASTLSSSFGPEIRARYAPTRVLRSCYLTALVCLLVIPAPVASAQGVLGAPRQRSGMAAVRRHQRPHPAVVRVSAPDGNAVSYGSGTLVDVRGEYGLVVTNWHVVRDATGPVTVVFPDGFQSAARVLRMDKDWDLAALVIWRPDVAAVPIARTAPRPGDRLTIAGYGSGNYRHASGHCTQYVAPGFDMPYEMVEVSVQARNGDSGGPIFNDQGELAGVLFGAARGMTSGSYAGRVRHFLAGTWPDLGAPSPSMIAATEQNKCRDGKCIAAIQPNAALKESQAESTWRARQSKTAMGKSPRPRKAAELRSPTTSAPRNRSSQESGFQSSPGPRSNGTTQIGTQSKSLEPKATHEISWNDLAGNTPFQQAKTLFALIGVAVVLMHATRIFVE